MVSTPNSRPGWPDRAWSEERLRRQKRRLRTMRPAELIAAVEAKRAGPGRAAQAPLDGEWPPLARGVSVVAPRWSQPVDHSLAERFQQLRGEVEMLRAKLAERPVALRARTSELSGKRDHRAVWRAPPMDPAEWAAAVRDQHARRRANPDGWPWNSDAILNETCVIPKPWGVSWGSCRANFCWCCTCWPCRARAQRSIDCTGCARSQRGC